MVSNILTQQLTKRSVHLSLFFFRNVHFSELRSGVHAYSKSHYNLLPLLTQEQRTLHNSKLKYTFNMQMLSFLIKCMYLDFLYSFLLNYTFSQRCISQTFLLFLLCNVSRFHVHTYLVRLLNNNRLRLLFFSFLNGYTSKTHSRLLFVLDNTSNSIFFLFWILRLFLIINNRVRLTSLIKKTFLLLVCASRKRSTLVASFIYMLLRLVTLSKRMSCGTYLPLDTYHIFTSFIFNHNLDNFRILNVALHFFLTMLRIGTNMYQLREILFRSSVRLFTNQIEHTLFSFTKVPYFFFARYYYKTLPPLNNARMLCNYMIIKLASGCKIKEAFDGVYTWQTYWKAKVAREYIAFTKKDSVDIRDFVYPVKGIRVICSGPPYKARRTTEMKYHV